MRCQEAKAVLGVRKAELSAFGITELYLFGSVARDEAGPESDVDVLIELDHVPTLFELARIKRSLEEWLQSRVDLGLKDSVRPALRDRIFGEAVRAA